ncbi:hypothetical protein IMCC9480_3782 [Oxalobacteraceae bacterium IMCC9480]|nr:hypothetical protein IMCC9480_3782 [Oxalobacteraceae bacterium IMCC9480]
MSPGFFTCIERTSLPGILQQIGYGAHLLRQILSALFGFFK